MTGEPIKLLLVDDHEIVRLGLKAALESNSELLVVGEASDGTSALEVANVCKPDVILMDIRMPVMDGIEATNQFKASSVDPKILIFTSNDSQDDMFAALAAGADGFCLKETSADKLALAIKTVHAGASWLDPKIAKVVLKNSTGGSTSSSSMSKTPIKTVPSFNLSERELQVLQLVVEGMSNQEIGGKLFLSPETVKTHMTHIISKLAVSDRTQAAVKALREGLIA